MSAKTLTIGKLVARLNHHFDADAEVTPELVDALSSFIAGQTQPHVVFTWKRATLHAEMTGGLKASWPPLRPGYGDPCQPVERMQLAFTWAHINGALTYEIIHNGSET